MPGVASSCLWNIYFMPVRSQTPQSRSSIGQFLHQLIDLVVHAPHTRLDLPRRVVREPVLRGNHVEDLIRGEENVPKAVEYTLAQGELDGRHRIEVEFF